MLGWVRRWRTWFLQLLLTVRLSPCPCLAKSPMKNKKKYCPKNTYIEWKVIYWVSERILFSAASYRESCLSDYFGKIIIKNFLINRCRRKWVKVCSVFSTRRWVENFLWWGELNSVVALCTLWTKFACRQFSSPSLYRLIRRSYEEPVPFIMSRSSFIWTSNFH